MNTQAYFTFHISHLSLINHCPLAIANSLKIACPALNPERRSLPAADYEASKFSAENHCKLSRQQETCDE